MATNSACERFIPLLSPYIDGEVSPADRVNVERHMAACRDCASRAADLRAESALLRVGLEMAVDDVDFKDFTQKVMARVTPDRPPLWERVRITLSEMFLYHRTAMVSSLATAALVVLVAVPVVLNNQRAAPLGYGAERMRVQQVVASEGAKTRPLVLESDDGNTIIWTVDQDASTPHDATPAGSAAGDRGEDADELDGESPQDVPGRRPVKPATPDKPPKGGEL
ncbi:anti-sigma factor family protein [Archangium primigenium]|uniref:anti-sigma factor family protein n=1 Tax=[Archangium] primigenium TaxID=2792470 RepID=UPI00195BCE90|nr:zf-HC2 domain-containing protein [Archangium primigenium]MBM7113185.1 zf-HC2 domain-containing protein [Archangium primigenium]